jgi:hypothetical protein
MSHDKISAAARKRMAETGEPYAAARRAVIREHQAAGGHHPSSGTKWFAISYSDSWEGRLSATLDRLLFRAGPGISGVDVDADEIRVRMGSFKLDIPRRAVRSVQRSQARVGRTAGVHGRRGRWLVNGSAEDLVELAIDPPCYISPSIDTLFGIGPSRVDQLTVSLEDPDGFMAAVEGDGHTTGPGVGVADRADDGPRGRLQPGLRPGPGRRRPRRHPGADRGDRAQPRPARPARRDTDLARLRETGLLDPLLGPEEASR